MKLNLKLITSSFVLASSLVLSQQSYASDNGLRENERVVKRQLGDEVWGDGDPRFGGEEMNKEALGIIFQYACEDGTHPIKLSSVNNYWYKVMQESEIIDPDKGDLDYSTMERFMQDCMDRYYSSPIRNMQLIHTDPNTKVKTVMSIPAGADLSKFVFEADNPDNSDIFKHVRITTSVDVFFKVKGENENKIVTLASTYGVIKRLHAGRLSNMIEEWEPSAAHVVLLFRFGNWEDLSWYYYHATYSWLGLSGDTLYHVACQAGQKGYLLEDYDHSIALPLSTFHVSFLNSPKNN